MSPLQATLETLEVEPLEVVVEPCQTEFEEIVPGEDATPDGVRLSACFTPGLCGCCCGS